MELSAIMETDDVQLKRTNKGERGLEESNDSGVASATDNSIEAGKTDDMPLKSLIVEFKALNANEEKTPIESTFVAKSKKHSGPCNISAIEGSSGNRDTINSEGKYKLKNT